MKQQNLWTILIAFLFGQLIQLVTVSMAHYLYVSDPVMVCIAVGIMTTAVVVLSSVFTLMENGTGEHRKRQTGINALHPVYYGKRPPLDTEPENVDEIDAQRVRDMLTKSTEKTAKE